MHDCGYGKQQLNNFFSSGYPIYYAKAQGVLDAIHVHSTCVFIVVFVPAGGYFENNNNNNNNNGGGNNNNNNNNNNNDYYGAKAEGIQSMFILITCYCVFIVV